MNNKIKNVWKKKLQFTFLIFNKREKNQDNVLRERTKKKIGVISEHGHQEKNSCITLMSDINSFVE
jgi:hypothetical protein